MIKYLLVIIGIYLTMNVKAQTVSDVDGNTYNTVIIGTQIWMKENLKTTKYSDNTNIPNITDNTTWSNLTTPAYCWYNNNGAVYKITYGALYNWPAVNTGKLCPSGWHVPNNTEWTTLTTYLGGENDAGIKMKSTIGWNSNGNGTNESGFTALPGGNRDPGGLFFSIGDEGCWWSSTEDNPGNAWVRHEGYYNSVVGKFYFNEKAGFSVRCINDFGTFTSNPLNINLVIYPNPAKDKLYIKNNKDSHTIMIIDLQGKQVINMLIGPNPIDISNLSNGVYLLKIVGSRNIIVGKLVKE